MAKKLAVVLVLCVLCSIFSIGCNKVVTREQPFSLTGVGNARELGGYKTEDGRTVKRGVLLRTAKLSNATEDDIRKLTEDYHLSVVVDFRGDTEIEQYPDPEISGVKNLNFTDPW